MEKKRLLKRFIAVFAVIAFPFILDALYGSGILGRLYNNSFGAEGWFTFIGSYFPATIIGILSLYQAQIIQEQERQYKKLLNRHRLIPNGHAYVYRYAKASHAIGQYGYDKIRQILVRNGCEELMKEWMSGYIIECNMYNASDIVINQVEVKKVWWEINGRVYEQRNLEKMAGIINRISHSSQQIVIFWLFEKTEKADEEVIRCMINQSRSDPLYETSTITFNVKAVDDERATFNLKMHYCLQSLSDTYKMSSIEENYYIE